MRGWASKLTGQKQVQERAQEGSEQRCLQLTVCGTGGGRLERVNFWFGKVEL